MVSDINRGLFVLAPDLAAVAECEDGIDNDQDGRIDATGGPGGELRDPGCSSSADPDETAALSSGGCGLGPELIPLLALLAALRRRAGTG